MSHKLTTQEMNRLSVDEFRASEKLPLTVVLDNVRSQNNIGSVFRTADAFRVGHISLCGICSTPPHREIHKTALGAEESVEWSYHEDTVECVRALKEQGYRIYAVEIAHNSLKLGKDAIAAAGPVALILGNEIDGVLEEVMNLCDGFIEIPQQGTKHSLNVSCAAAITIWEISKLMRQ
ncbi:MAG: tRNA/rRNA methyltransferase (SpoU) [bacterium P3]|nr:MAG: tRNA/rRNA methyltransferase (SpoU) [bacterium P3]KWW38682.1 MAG: tRNA/rRNA methyltransferase (SpoU) [bacterium F083]